MKITLTLISFLRPVFFTNGSTCIRYGRWQSCFLHRRFLAKSHQISTNNYSVHITQVHHVKMSTETKLHTKVKPRYHNEDNPGDKG